MKAFSLALTISVLSEIACAGPVADQFRDGFNGASWGATLDSIVAMYPPGDHVFASTPGERAYWIRDSTMLLNVPRDGQGVLFGFTEDDTLSNIVIGFQYERQEQIVGALISAFGAPDRVGTKGTKAFQCWRPDAKIALCFWSSRQAKHGIAWLSVYGPNYQRGRGGSTPSNTSLEGTRKR